MHVDDAGRAVIEEGAGTMPDYSYEADIGAVLHALDVVGIR